jgi:Uncharacterized conserved protein
MQSNRGFVWVGVGILFLIGISFVLPILSKEDYVVVDKVIEVASSTEPVFVVTHIGTPEPLKAIYVTSCVASTPSWRNNLKKFVEETELNSVVIDIKDYSGDISLEPGAECFVRDMKEFIGELHDADIYVIGRITVFQDPKFAELHPEMAVKSKSTGGTWRDRKGLAFIDVGAREYWGHIVELSKEAYEIGFDEINFDYIRYPSDGNMQDAHYSLTVGTSTRVEMLESFFSHLHLSLKGTGVKTSADIFGFATLLPDDLGIGQVLENILPYFDYVYPMVYPSHYSWNVGGFGDPATHPYEIVKYSMTTAVAREQAWNLKNGRATSTPSKLKPWLQDFDLGAQYGVAEVQAQMKATYDSGLTGWIFWDAGNKYTREAYLVE